MAFKLPKLPFTGGKKQKKTNKSNNKKGRKLGFGFGHKKKVNYINQLHLEPVSEDALIDKIHAKLKDPNEPYIKSDSLNYIYLIGLTNKLIGEGDLANNLGDLKSALNLSNQSTDDWDQPGSIVNASFDTDIDPVEDPDHPDRKAEQQIVFLPTINTLDTLSSITDASKQKYIVTTIPGDISASNLNRYYDSGVINGQISLDDNQSSITYTLAGYENFVKAQIDSGKDDDDSPEDDNGEPDDDSSSNDESQDDIDNSANNDLENADVEDNNDDEEDIDDDDDKSSEDPLIDDSDDSDNEENENDENGDELLNDKPDESTEDDKVLNELNNPDNSDTDDLATFDDNSDASDNTDDDKDKDVLNFDNPDEDDNDSSDNDNVMSIDGSDKNSDSDNKPSADDDIMQIDGDNTNDNEKSTDKANDKKDKPEKSDKKADDVPDLNDVANLGEFSDSNETKEPKQDNKAQDAAPVSQASQSSQETAPASDNENSQETVSPSSEDTNQGQPTVPASQPASANTTPVQPTMVPEDVDNLSNEQVNNYPDTSKQEDITQQQTAPASEENKADNENENSTSANKSTYQFNDMVENVVPVNKNDYINLLKDKLKDSNEHYVYADVKSKLIYLPALNQKLSDEDRFNERDLGIIEYEIKTGQKYGDIQNSLLNGSFEQDLEKHQLIFIPSLKTLDVLDDIVKNGKMLIVTVPYDINVDNFDNYNSLHQINVEAKRNGKPMEMSVPDFKEFVDRLRESNKSITNAKNNKRIVINVDNPTNLHQIGASINDKALGKTNKQALDDLIDQYMPQINSMLSSILVPTFGIDPIKDTNPAVVANKRFYNDELKNDANQIKTNIKDKIVRDITNSVRPVIDPRTFAKNYPHINSVLREKYLNEDSIKNAVQKQIRKINVSYENKRQNMIDDSINKAKQDFKNNELPKKQKEIDKTDDKIRDFHKKMYHHAIDRVLQAQREKHNSLINAKIESILDNAQQDVDEGKNELKSNTKYYLINLVNANNNYRAPGFGATPVMNNNSKDNSVKLAELESKLEGTRMASQESVKERDNTIKQLQEQLAAEKEKRLQAQKDAEQIQQAQQAQDEIAKERKQNQPPIVDNEAPDINQEVDNTDDVEPEQNDNPNDLTNVTVDDEKPNNEPTNENDILNDVDNADYQDETDDLASQFSNGINADSDDLNNTDNLDNSGDNGLHMEKPEDDQEAKPLKSNDSKPRQPKAPKPNISHKQPDLNDLDLGNITPPDDLDL